MFSWIKTVWNAMLHNEGLTTREQVGYGAHYGREIGCLLNGSRVDSLTTAIPAEDTVKLSASAHAETIYQADRSITTIASSLGTEF
jgi:hypothetical protein